MDTRFNSVSRKVGETNFPRFSGIRVMMMPIVIGDPKSIPSHLSPYSRLLLDLFEKDQAHAGRVGYLTIDEKIVQAGKTHRRAGLHVDGIFRQRGGGWGGGGGGGWGAIGTGMLTVSSVVGCRAWNQEFEGLPGPEGECHHLADQARPEAEVLFGAGEIHWVDGLCVHESIPMAQDTERAFVRLSNPSTAPWFEGYTENPLGILPTGPILPRRAFMDAK